MWKFTKGKVKCEKKGFKIGKSQAADIIKNKERLLNKWTLNNNLDERGSFLTGEGSRVDKICYNWFVTIRYKGVPLTGTL